MNAVVDMTTNEFSNLRKQAEAELTRAKLSRKAGAKIIGIGETMFSQFMNGIYTPMEVPAEAVTKWLQQADEEKRLRAAVPDAPSFIPTPTSKKIIATLKYAQMSGDMIAMYGGPGVGKTMALNHYRNSGNNVWKTTATAAQRKKSERPTLRLLAKMLDLPFNGATDEVFDNIVRKVRHTKGLIIIDEAQKIPIDAVEAVRDIHDATGVAIALVGNEVVNRNLTGAGMRADFAQLSSRIGRFVEINQPTRPDAYAIAQAFGIEKGTPVGHLCVKMARQHGGLRALVKTLQVASFYSDGKDIDLGTLRQVWKERGGGVLS